MNHWFACEIEESLWPAGEKSPTVTRLDRGFAATNGSEREGFRIEAATEPFDENLRSLASALPRLTSSRSFDAMPDNISPRVLTRSSAVSDGRTTYRSSLRVIVLSTSTISIVATPESLTRDISTLVTHSRREPSRRIDPREFPVAWQSGSGAVLAHEAIGHPAERGIFSDDLPRWLQVDDLPSSGEILQMETDDTGAAVGPNCLTERQRPAAMRRWSHRDVPARRMTNLVVRGTGSPLEDLPGTRVDVHLVAHGFWNPTTDSLGVRVVAADLVDGTSRSPLEPFTYTLHRSELPRLLSGWFGELTRHPGVLCGDEGVQLPVGSAAVGLLTGAV